MDISKAKDILDYWFHPNDRYTPDNNKWFIRGEEYDDEIKEKFGDLLKEAEKGKGFGWLHTKDSFVAYIILMDQFSRHIYRGTSDAFKNDNGVMIFTELGFDIHKNSLEGYEFMFVFMPYMHTEYESLQQKGEEKFYKHKSLYTGTPFARHPYRQLTTTEHPNYNSRMGGYPPEKTNYDKEYKMLNDMEPHVIGHKMLIFRYGRFPKRNKVLGRENTLNEEIYLQHPGVQKRFS